MSDNECVVSQQHTVILSSKLVLVPGSCSISEFISARLIKEHAGSRTMVEKCPFFLFVLLELGDSRIITCYTLVC